MNVWILNPFDPLPGEPGPVLRYGYMSRLLSEKGHNVTWWSSDFSHREKRRRRLPEVELPYTLRLVPVPPYRRNISFARWRNHREYGHGFLRLAGKMLASGDVPGPDIIWVSLPPLQGLDAVLRLPRDRRGRVVLDWMDLWPDTFYQVIPLPGKLREWVGRCVFAPLHRRLRHQVRQVDAVTGVASRYLKRVRDYGFEGSATLLHHGVDIHPLSRDHFDRDKSVPLRVVYIGAMGRSYNLKPVLDALAAAVSSGVSLQAHFAGGGEDQSELRQYSSENGLDPYVEWHGYLGTAPLRKLLRSCDVGIIPQHPASGVIFPYKMADYAEAGLAIISSLRGESAEYLKRFAAGSSFPAGNYHALADQLTRYARDPDHLHQTRQGSRRMAEQAFDRCRSYTEVIRSWESIASKQ